MSESADILTGKEKEIKSKPEKMGYSKDRKSWFVCDPCGIVCAFMTYFLIAYGELVLVVVLVPPFPTWGTFLCGAIFTSLAVLSVVSHVKSMTTDPGVVPRESSSEEEVLERRQKGEEIRFCKKCRSIKPDRAHHCSTCEACIQRMDHHCPWINNCVGENNQKFFVLFTFYIMSMSVFGLGMVAVFFFRCAGQNFQGCDILVPGPLAFILTLFGVFEGFLFSLFTCIMFGTQVHAIATDETGIESLKKENRDQKGWRESFEEIFGSPVSVKWLSPFTAPPNQHHFRRRVLLTV